MSSRTLNIIGNMHDTLDIDLKEKEYRRVFCGGLRFDKIVKKTKTKAMSQLKYISLYGLSK